MVYDINFPSSVHLPGKLLMAHKALMDLENSRDELMFELHRLPQQSPTDRNTLKHYFNEVDKLSDELAKQVFSNDVLNDFRVVWR